MDQPKVADISSEEKVVLEVPNVSERNFILSKNENVSTGDTGKPCVPIIPRGRKIPGNKLIPLVNNDRDIPDFLEKEHRDEIDLCCHERRTDSTSKATQTRVSGIKESMDVLSTSDLHRPTSILNSKKSSTPNYQNQELMMTRSQLNNVHRKYQKLKTRFHNLHSDYHKLLGIAKEFTTVLEKAAYGGSVDPQNTLKTCMKIYPDLFNQNVRDGFSITRMGSSADIYNIDDMEKKSMLSAVPLSPKHLDYKKIKLHLINGNLKTKLLLLQALRWTITLSQPEDRDEVIHEYIKNDLLGIHGQIASDSGKLILPYLLIPLDVVVPHPLQQSAARLLNTFASLKCGRDYLAVGPTVLNVVREMHELNFIALILKLVMTASEVVQCLDSTSADSIDAFTCDMIIAMLQKLSLRRHQRLYMIAAGMVEWLIHHLKAEYHSMGTYRFEYATALLMNLSLHKEAQIRAAAMAKMVISTLIVLLSTDHLPALQYVNGALNNFLTNSAINEEAKLTGLGSILEYYRKHRTGKLREHLDDILIRHRRQRNEIIQEEIKDDDDREEYDVLEDELDEMDPVKVHAGDLFGETLLAICYCLTPTRLQVVQNITHLSPSTFNVHDESSSKTKNENSLDNSTLMNDNKQLPRLTPANHKPKYPNPVKLQSLTSQENTRMHEESFPDIKHTDSTETLLVESSSSFLMHCSASQESRTAFNHAYYPITFVDDFNQELTRAKKIYPPTSRTLEEYREKSRRISSSTEKTLVSEYSKVERSKINLSRESTNGESAVYLYANHRSKESSKNAVNSAIISVSPVGSTHEVEDRMNSIPSLEVKTTGAEGKEEEEAFAAKPKIFRTPPQSATSRKSSVSGEFTDET